MDSWDLSYRHDGARYHIDGHRGEAGFTDLLKWQLNGQRARWPKWVENRRHAPPPERVGGAAMSITWIGHSTVLVQAGGLNILTDPFLSFRASPSQIAGPRRVRAPGLTAAEMPPIDLVLVSHNHYDHLDLPALSDIARHHQPRIVTPAGNARLIARASRALQVHELDWYEGVNIGQARVTVTPAFHWSKRTAFDTNQALWGAFVLETGAGTIYFAGDTGFGDGVTFEAVRRRFGPPRLSLLPIGAYEPRWFMRPQHMNPEEAADAHLLLESQTSLAIHHGTIQLTDEAIDAPAKALSRALAGRSIDPGRFLVPDIGESIPVS